MECAEESPKLLYGVVAGSITVAVLAFLFYSNQRRDAASSAADEDAGVEEFEDSEGSSDFSDSEGSASEPDAHDAFFPSEKGSQPTPISRQFARKLASAGDTHNRRPRSAGDADPPKRPQSNLFTRTYRPLIMPMHLQMQAQMHSKINGF